jgi:type III pantothenate kinase
MNLIVDIGNSFMKLAIYQDGELLEVSRHKKVLVKDIKALHAEYPFSRSIVSSVRKEKPYFLSYLAKHHKLLTLSHKTKVPIKNEYGTPQTLGLDRLAVMVAAAVTYPDQSALVIDIGTCMTYDYLEKGKTYLGGNIAPGVELRLKAMHHFTSALPLVSRSWNDAQLGMSTKEALQNGAVWGIKLEIEAFIKTLTKKRGKMTVILTGGDATYFGEHLDSKIFVAPNFLLKGLNAILEHNH